jgi:hypothetical protein
MRKRISKVVRGLLILILCFGVIWVIAGRSIGNFLTSRGKLLYESGNRVAANRYFQVARIFHPSSVDNNYYLNDINKTQGGRPSINEIRKLLKSKDDDIVINAFEIIKQYKIFELRKEVESLAEKGSDSVSEAADEVLFLFRSLATPMRCSACNARYTSKLPEGDMPYICMKCRNRALYTEDRFTIDKLYCNNCGGITIRENIPGKGYSTVCSKCGKSGISQMFLCRSCGYKWGGGGIVMSCPKCGAKEVGAVSVTIEEAAQFRQHK